MEREKISSINGKEKREICVTRNRQVLLAFEYSNLYMYIYIYFNLSTNTFERIRIINKDAMDIYACSTRNIIGTHRFRHVKLDSWSTWPLAGCTCQTAFFHHPLPTSRDIFFLSFILRATRFGTRNFNSQKVNRKGRFTALRGDRSIVRVSHSLAIHR